MRISCSKEMTVYQREDALAMENYRLPTRFSAEKRYALVSQFRRSSGSVCLNLREAWSKRRYEGHFLMKLTACDGEANEADSSLGFARDCSFLESGDHARLMAVCSEIRRRIGAVLSTPKPFLITETGFCPLSSAFKRLDTRPRPL